MPVITDSQRLAIRPFNPRRTASAIPPVNIHETPTRCLTINASWASHILGILDLLAQPDAWLGSEEQKYEATQQIEEIILELSKACPERPTCPECEECEECEECGNNAGCGGSNEESEDNEMGQVVTDVTTDSDGNIWVWFGPCCKKMLSGLAVPSDGDLVAGDKTPLIEKPDDVEQTDWACRMATACALLLEDVAAGLNNHAALPNIFVNWVKDNVKQCDWSTSSLTKIFYNWLGWNLVPLPGLDSGWNDVDTTMIKARWRNVIEGKSSSLTADDFNAMKTAVVSYFGASRGGAWAKTMDYITRNRFQEAIDNADMSGVQDCDEPAPIDPEEAIPVAHTWSKVLDFTQGAYGFTTTPGAVNMRYEAGVGFVCDQLDGGAGNMPQFARVPPLIGDYDQETYLKYIKIFIPQHGKTDATGNWIFVKWGDVNAVQGPGSMAAGDIAATNSPIGWSLQGNKSFRVGDGYWYDQPSGFKFVVSKVIIAGDGHDRFAGLQPDGSIV